MTLKSKEILNNARVPSFLTGNSRKDKSETLRLMEIYIEGINAEAKVVSIEEAGVFWGRNYYKMTLDVCPHHSDKFRTTGYAPVSFNLLPRTGDLISIKYNPSDNEKFVII